VRARKHGEPPRERQPVERRLDPAFPQRSRGRERDELVAIADDFDETAEHAAEVVADARPRQRQRAHVDDDSHGLRILRV
jgi:hypothetical protein